MMTKENMIDAAHESIIQSDVKNKPNKATVERVIDAAFKAIAASLGAGETVLLPGLGRLAVVDRKATRARNPRTGDFIQIPARRAVRFSAGTKVKESVNGPKTAEAKA
jgi:DNA-binding protein HU-beta